MRHAQWMVVLNVFHRRPSMENSREGDACARVDEGEEQVSPGSVHRRKEQGCMNIPGQQCPPLEMNENARDREGEKVNDHQECVDLLPRVEPPRRRHNHLFVESTPDALNDPEQVIRPPGEDHLDVHPMDLWPHQDHQRHADHPYRRKELVGQDNPGDGPVVYAPKAGCQHHDAAEHQHKKRQGIDPMEKQLRLDEAPEPGEPQIIAVMLRIVFDQLPLGQLLEQVKNCHHEEQ